MSKLIPIALENLFTGKSAENFASVEIALEQYAALAGLDKPHRLVHYLAQLAHESGQFQFDRELWGPTPGQAKYDTRADLGNSPAQDGDGKLYLGRSALQMTGKANYREFANWCKSRGLITPDFVQRPDLVNTDPWEGLAPIWFWSTRNLNSLADENDIEQITKRINGGLNGYEDRLNQYTRIGLVLCGFAPSDIHGFQEAARQRGCYAGDTDGDSGPRTRAAIHKWLAATVDAPVTAAPVVEAKPVAVAPKGAEKTTLMRVAGAVALAGPTLSSMMPSGDWPKLIFVGIGVLGVLVLLWRGERIASRVQAIMDSFER